MTWQEDVYQPAAEDDRPDNHKGIRKLILMRDKNTCQRCFTERQPKYLTVHHIVPRSEGGTWDFRNLILLCETCHNYVELKGISSREGIMKSAGKQPEMEQVFEEDFERPDWHAVVYGGAKPYRGRTI